MCKRTVLNTVSLGNAAIAGGIVVDIKVERQSGRRKYRLKEALSRSVGQFSSMGPIQPKVVQLRQYGYGRDRQRP